MDIVVIGGGIPQPDEPLYPYTRGKPKALLDILGKPMLQWELDAFSDAKGVENVIVIGLSQDSGLTCSKPLSFFPNKRSMIENILAGVNEVKRINPSATRVLLATGDIPAITPEMVDWEIKNAATDNVNLCYNVVRREVMEARYPYSKRTYIRLKDMEVCGGDMNMLSTSVTSLDPAIWEKLTAARKKPFKQAYILGLDNLLLLLLRVISLDDAVSRISKRLHMTGRAIVCPYAEIAMDVDKPHQLELLRTDLASKVKH